MCTRTLHKSYWIADSESVQSVGLSISLGQGQTSSDSKSFFLTGVRGIITEVVYCNDGYSSGFYFSWTLSVYHDDGQ